MPRLSSSFVPKYRKHRNSGQAVVTLAGVDHYLGPHGTRTSHNEYDRLIAEWLENGRQPTVSIEDGLTLTELIVRYWKFAESYYRKDGSCTREAPGIKRALKPVRELYGVKPAAEFGPIALKVVRSKLVEDGISRTYANAQIGRVKRMFRWAVNEELIPAETYQALVTVPGLRRGRTEARETSPVLPVDDSAVDATLPHLPDVVADMVRLQRITGMRPAELCMMRPSDLDRSDDVWTYRPESHKTEHHGRDRVIFLGPQAQEVLLRYLARDSQAYCFSPVDSEAKRLVEQEANRKTARSCGNIRGSNVKKKPKKKPGEKYDVNSYRRAIHRACDKAGVDRWSPNRLRHSAATEIRKRFGLEAAQVTLGHASADITQVYAERDNTLAIEVAAKIG